MLKQLFSTLKVLTLALILSFGLSYALAWTSPTATPPGGNVDAPINVGGTAQVKTGGLTVGSLNTGTLKVTTGAGAAKVLTSDAAGNATWQAAAGGSDNLGNHTATQNLNLAGFGITGVNTINVAGNGAATFGPNSTWGAYLTVGGNGRTTTNATVATTNGNLHLDAQNGGFGTYLNWYASGTTGVHVGNGAAAYGPLYANDVYINSKAKWVSASMFTKTNNIYQAPAYATARCSTDGLFINCTNTCGGQITTSATCLYAGCAMYGCAAASAVGNTFLGSLVQ